MFAPFLQKHAAKSPTLLRTVSWALGNTTKGIIMSIEIEEDLEIFLKEGRQLEYDESIFEAGKVGLVKYEDLKESYINAVGPEYGKNYYSIPAVNLTSAAEGHNPEYILMWLPNEKKYGAWDDSHWLIYIFEDAKWSDIVADPLSYINAAFDGCDNAAEFNPEKDYKLKSGFPDTETRL
jgi:hypothetical protein